MNLFPGCDVLAVYPPRRLPVGWAVEAFVRSADTEDWNDCQLKIVYGVSAWQAKSMWEELVLSGAVSYDDDARWLR